jgi:hypothetical protein
VFDFRRSYKENEFRRKTLVLLLEPLWFSETVYAKAQGKFPFTDLFASNGAFFIEQLYRGSLLKRTIITSNLIWFEQV